jgi:hypothetical protein
LVAPSGGTPPRSGVGHPLERGHVSIESRAPPRASLRLARGHHGPATSIPAPPAGVFNALTIRRRLGQRRIHATTRLGIAPRHYAANSPGDAIPALCNVVRHGQATTPWNCATHSRTADASHPRKRTAEPSKGRRTTTPRLCKDNVVTSGRRDWSPPSPSTLCDHPRRPQHHPGHYITIPDVVEACGDGTPPRRLLYPCTASRQWHGRSPNRRPLHRHPRSRS